MGSGRDRDIEGWRNRGREGGREGATEKKRYSVRERRLSFHINIK